MKFMLLLRANALTESGEPPEPETMEAMAAFVEEMMRAGVFVSSEGLYPSAAGTRVSNSGTGESTIKPGPFPNTEELIAAFWLIDVPSTEQALDWAQRVPFLSNIEVRRVISPEDFAQM